MTTDLPRELKQLVDRAVEGRRKAYAPYSKFAVGAAIRTTSGRIFEGCNVENAAFGMAMCAERVALYSAVAAGETAFSELALIADQLEPLSPCGACRQVILEMAPKIVLVMANLAGEAKVIPMQDLLPLAFVFKPRITR